VGRDSREGSRRPPGARGRGRAGASRRPRHTTWSAVELIKALHCYEYQSCEHPGWRTSQAHSFCRALERRLIGELPGYDDAPWAISSLDTPAAERRADTHPGT